MQTHEQRIFRDSWFSVLQWAKSALVWKTTPVLRR
jgi:hypothetical protein